MKVGSIKAMDYKGKILWNTSDYFLPYCAQSEFYAPHLDNDSEHCGKILLIFQVISSFAVHVAPMSFNELALVFGD